MGSSYIAKARTRLTSDRNPTESEPILNIEDIFDYMLRRKDDRVRNESVFVSLDSAYHSGLRFGCLIMVNNTNSSEELIEKNTRIWIGSSLLPKGQECAYRHRDGHLAFRHCIHWTAHKWGLEHHFLSDPAVYDDI